MEIALGLDLSDSSFMEEFNVVSACCFAVHSRGEVCRAAHQNTRLGWVYGRVTCVALAQSDLPAVVIVLLLWRDVITMVTLRRKSI